MAYESGTTSGVEDLLDKIRVVALARGWTVNCFNSIDASTKYLALQKGSERYNLLSVIDATLASYFIPNYIYAFTSSNYVDDVSPRGVSDPSIDCVVNGIGSGVPYKIFSGADYIHVVLEVSTGLFVYLMMGVLSKYGAYTGGAYLTATRTGPDSAGLGRYLPPAYRIFSNLTVHLEVDTFHDFWGIHHDGTGGVTDSKAQVNKHTAIDKWVSYGRNDFNLISPLAPVIVYAHRGSELFSPIGEMQDIRVVNMTNFNSGDTITLGGDTYELYSAGTEASTDTGIAFKKIV